MELVREVDMLLMRGMECTLKDDGVVGEFLVLHYVLKEVILGGSLGLLPLPPQRRQLRRRVMNRILRMASM